LILWFEEVFKEIGNAFRFFYDADNSFHSLGYMAMARILVRLELSKSLVDSIMIQKEPTIFYQSLDYKGIPLKCGWCHEYGHLAKEYPLLNKRKVWVCKAHQGNKGIV
jgi:hypothetical protein